MQKLTILGGLAVLAFSAGMAAPAAAQHSRSSDYYGYDRGYYSDRVHSDRDHHRDSYDRDYGGSYGSRPYGSGYGGRPYGSGYGYGYSTERSHKAEDRERERRHRSEHRYGGGNERQHRYEDREAERRHGYEDTRGRRR